MYLWMVLLLLNVVAFAMAWADKQRARRKAWRIPEKRLMWMAVLGGSVGLYLGCRTFRHKTNHAKFMVGVPVILAVQVVCAVTFLLFREPIGHFFTDTLAWLSM